MKRFSNFIQESVELDEKLKATDKMGTWVKDFQDSDAPQFKGKSQKKRQQMAVAAKLSAERDAGMREEVELDQETQYEIVESYLLENNIDVDSLTEEELNELIGKVIGGAFKVGAKAAVGAGRLAKKAANRMSTAGRADAAEKRAAAAEKRNKDRERIETARKRLRDAQKAAREAKSGATT